ncbi:hypothetical protein BKA62DRAFT_716484 [Auriculariales sp. MPI-PUGE-AT-0066]|nr:hypothetical protein BKA62DRAFT_716484 [Auriculariales sp. MPI-PUGE-AT-0066]
MALDTWAGLGTDYEVQDQDYVKRAVLKAAPTCFTVEVLAPVKHGRAHSYGVRIIPVNPQQFQMMRDDDSDSTSIQSIGREYEIWRRWDDCLDFQYKLEQDYERKSWTKKSDLKHGKKGSGDGGGLYRNPKAASSFESLPEGPDPRNIKVDLHAYVPKLTKKSSFFSVSDSTVQKRAEEFAALVYALFKMDCPKLIEELRDSSTVRDFFAWWRRDQDLLEKRPQRPGSVVSHAKPGPPGPSPSRVSMDTSSIFTAPPSPDSPGFSMLKRNEKVYVHPQRSPTESSSTIMSPISPQMSEKVLPSPPTSPEMRQILRSPVALRSRGGTPQLQISRPMVHPQYNDHGLYSPVAQSPRTRPSPTLPGVGRMVDAHFARSVTPTSIGSSFASFAPTRTMTPVSIDTSFTSHGTNPECSSDSSTTPPITPTVSPSRERPLSQLSVNSMDSDFNIDLSFIKLAPAPPGAGKGRANTFDASRSNKRDSMISISSLASVDSVRTTDSSEGVLPSQLRRSSRTARPRRKREGPWSPDSHLRAAVPEEDESVFYHSDDSQGEDADPFSLEINQTLDDTMSFMEQVHHFPSVPGQSTSSRDRADPETDSGVRSYYRDRDWRMSFPASVRESVYDSDFDSYDSAPSSPTSTIHGTQPMSESGHSDYSTSTVRSLELEPGMCSVKAKFDDVIVALRLPLGTPLSTLRARLCEKFVQAQGIQLHYRFSLAYTPPRRHTQMLQIPSANEMPIILTPAALEFSESSLASRPKSVYPSVPDSAASFKRLIPIWSQDDWEEALQNCGNKVILHVFDQEVR